MTNILALEYDEKQDKALIENALGGSKSALEQLIKIHYNYIYNVALRFVLNPQDAQDITQEVIVKVITKLSQFKMESQFRTWLYRIVFNHFLSSKKQTLEFEITTFEAYGDDLDQMESIDLTDAESLELKEAVEDAKIGCMTGMLLCLNREQRLVFILGELFQVESKIGSEILEMSSENYRKILSRSRHDLYQFMNNKCGLINQNNPCRCPKKTKSFIACGWVNVENLQFNSDFIDHLSDIARIKVNKCDTALETSYAELYRNHPMYDRDQSESLVRKLVSDETIKDIFNLN